MISPVVHEGTYRLCAAERPISNGLRSNCSSSVKPVYMHVVVLYVDGNTCG
jgi:hypothetical protein